MSGIIIAIIRIPTCSIKSNENNENNQRKYHNKIVAQTDFRNGYWFFFWDMRKKVSETNTPFFYSALPVSEWTDFISETLGTHSTQLHTRKFDLANELIFRQWQKGSLQMLCIFCFLGRFITLFIVHLFNWLLSYTCLIRWFKHFFALVIVWLEWFLSLLTNMQ